jgi:Thioredoxin like C-terminal domain
MPKDASATTTWGRGEYAQSETVLQQLLREAGSDPGRALVSPQAGGIEAAADWAGLRTAENYTGYERTVGFASPGGMRPDRSHAYAAPERLGLNEWALSGGWIAGEQAIRNDASGASILYRFQARDLDPGVEIYSFTFG